MERASLARCVGRGVDEVGDGLGHASLASYGGGGVSRAGKERASLARCLKCSSTLKNLAAHTTAHFDLPRATFYFTFIQTSSNAPSRRPFQGTMSM